MWAPGALGNATTMPGVRPAPVSSSVPWVETWCGLPLQWTAGTQLTLWIRTLVTWGDGWRDGAGALEELAGLCVELAPGLVEALPGACAPPALAALAGSERAPSARSATATAVAVTSL